jgi:flagellar hook-associated protein FlgK
MLQVMHSAASAVRAFSRGMVVSAHNVANMNTEGYYPQEATYVESGNGGVDVDIRTSGTQGVNLEQEQVNLIASEAAIKANMEVIRASDKTLGVLLDTVG